MNYHKKPQLGGELGAELERMWEAIRSNQIKTGPGQRINRTPSGTTVSFSANQVSATVQGAATSSHGIFLHDPHLAGATPRNDMNGQSPFQQLALWFRVDTVEQLVLLPPKPDTQGGFGHTVYDHWSIDGLFWPQTLRTSPGARGWYFTKQLHKNESFQLQRLNNPLPVSYLTQFGRDTTVIASAPGGGQYGTLDPNTTINYFMRSLPPDPINPSIVNDWSWDSGP